MSVYGFQGVLKCSYRSLFGFVDFNGPHRSLYVLIRFNVFYLFFLCPYRSLCVFMDSIGWLWLFMGSHESLWVLLGPYVSL